jgi:type 1 fimbria pilin
MLAKSRWVCALAAAAAILAAVGPLAAAAPAGQVTVTGEVIDSACYIKDGSHGESHRGCMQSCADNGVPLAILEEGTNHVVWVASKADMDTPNKDLRPFAARRVTVKGTWAERGGTKLLLIDSVEAAKGK